MANEEVQKGIITRIYVKNFVTYDEVTVRPGRNFNLIIGPNGTGKSTIVCAIVLGLGGHTKVIGRATHVGDFVKNGQDSAIIEIDLQMDHENCVTVKRCFDTKSHSTWFVNNNSATFKQVIELMKSFNIQVDNLCQFLPQDKVQEFSNLQPPNLLIETERSVGDPKLLKYHKDLVDLRKKQVELESELERSTKIYANDKTLYDSLKDSVGSINEEKQNQKKLTSLRQKKAWILYQNRREEFVQAKKGRDKAAAKMKKIEKTIEPVKKKIEKLKLSINSLDKTAKQHLSETNAKRNKLNQLSDEIERHERSVNEFETQCKQNIKSEQESDERINQLIEDKNKMENDLTELIKDVGRIEDINESLNAINMEMSNQRKNLNDKNSQETFYKQQIDHINRKIQAEERNLQNVYNIENKRLDLLRKISSDTYQGVLWLRSNKHLFSRPIHEPMLLNINLKDPKYSKYFESVIPLRDLTAFVCEDKNDMNLLIKYLRIQQKLKVNAVHSDPNKQVDYTPIIPLENIKQFGFYSYLVSLIEAPKTVMNYIVSMYRISQIPVGSDHVSNNLDHIPEMLTRFFSESNLYSVSRSKYTNEKSTRQANVSSRDTLAITIDYNKIHCIEQEINASKEKVNALSEELQKCQAEIVDMNRQIESNKIKRNKLQTNKSKIDNLKIRINVNDESIKKEQKNRRNIDDIQSEFKIKIQNIIKQQLNVYQTFSNLIDEFNKSILIDEEMKLQIKLKKNEQAYLENDSAELLAELAEAERNYKRLENELMPLKNEVQELYDAAKEATGGLCYDSPDFAPIKVTFAKLPASIEEIIAEIQATQAKIFCLQNNQSEANRILQQFNNAKKNMERLDQIIKEKDAELTKVTEDIIKTKEEWYPALQALVDKINENFSNNFLKMKCAGEVSLSQGDNPMDFEKYGLKIRVKFRDADELQVLTRNHQSGGERAVTTAVYMIALQELTRVPFRCVDEINQGMDATNERRVFELIVNITSKSNNSQYFLLTPKLLPNLKYNESITVLTVFNGRYMAPISKFDINRDCDSIVEAVLRRRNAKH